LKTEPMGSLKALSAIEWQWIAVGSGHGMQGRIQQTNNKEICKTTEKKNSFVFGQSLSKRCLVQIL